MPPGKFIAKVAGHRELARDIFEKTFELVEPTEISYDAGNYVSVRVMDGKMPIVFRAYTFATDGSDGQSFKIIFKVFRDESGTEGRGSGYLKNLKPGESAEFFGPAGMGSFVPKRGDDSPLFLLGTGTGIAPLFAVATKLTRAKSPRLIKLFLGVSYIEEVFYLAEFEKLKSENPNFDFTIAVSRPPEDLDSAQARINFEAGRLTAVLDTIEIPKNLEALVCGSEVSTLGIRKKLLELGVPEKNIDAEGYGEV
ncbi:MAG: FAD-dependent oxidoreductase [Candidatus Peribacteraceae bacterium]|nr:FAD-dependent oxidoreductase [Candidatus Peribacteraceae bacterium]